MLYFFLKKGFNKIIELSLCFHYSEFTDYCNHCYIDNVSELWTTSFFF